MRANDSFPNEPPAIPDCLFIILHFHQFARRELTSKTLRCDVKNRPKRYIAPTRRSDTDGRNLTDSSTSPAFGTDAFVESGIGEWTAMPITKNLRMWILGLAALTGCNAIQDCVDEQVSACVNKHRAKMAWCACRPNYVECQENLFDFGMGFRKGYEDVLNGANTCSPPYPPRSYWGICYQNDSGRCAVAAWFDGYHHGVAVALADGYGSYHELPFSNNCYRNCASRPVQIDLEAYKASQGQSTSPQMMGTDGLPPIPESIPGAIPAQPPLPDYSPNALPAPPEEPNAAAAIEPELPVQ